MTSRQVRDLFTGFMLSLLLTAPLAAQRGAIAGRITDAETGQGISSATIQALVGDNALGSALTDASGRYRIAVEPGSYALLISMVGYEQVRLSGLEVGAGETVTQDVALISRAFQLNPVTVTASRRQEKILDAPAHVEVVTSREIVETTAITVADHLDQVPGVDIARNGLVSSNVVTRGFNNVFSGAILMLTDNRIARVPSLRLNAFYLIPQTNEDVERIEVLLGPASALYGPNSADGVFHMITKSPLDEQGTTFTFSGGGHAATDTDRFVPALDEPDATNTIFQGSVRHAMRLGDDVGFKISANYMRGGDFENFDEIEDQTRAAALAGGADPDDLRIGQRDFDVERANGEARLDWRPADDAELVLSFGSTYAGSAIELTGLGAAQADNWIYNSYQARFRKDRLFAQVFANTSDAGDTFLLRTGESIIDNSKMFASQVQHGFDLAEGDQSFTYGVDLLFTVPSTMGTITGRNEDDDNLTEIGGYVHSETALTDKINLVAAARLDSHSEIDDLILSPRAALVFKPTESQNVRFTWNRAFSTPTTNNLFLDLQAAQIGGGFLQVRALGVPDGGLRFRRDCQFGIADLCMRSPFAPDAGLTLPANAAVMWGGAVALARQGLLEATGIDIANIPAPGPGDVATQLRVLNPTTGTFQLIDPGSLLDVPDIQETTTNTLEAGYKGIFNDRISVAFDVYYTRKENFIGPLIVETPNVFFDRASLTTYLLNNGVTNPTAAGIIASAIAGIPEGTGSLAGVPLGIVGWDHPLADIPNAMFLTYRNFGEVDIWGTDLGVEVLLTDEVSLSGSVSHVSDDFFPKEEVGGISDVALNAPKNKGSASVNYRGIDNGWFGEVRGRFKEGFPMNSGAFVGDIEGFGVLDVNIGYRLPWSDNSLVALSIQNLFNERHREFIGAPVLGTVGYLKLQYGI